MWGTHLDSPLGRLRLVCNDDALLSVSFSDHRPAPVHTAPDGTHPILDAASAQLRAWFAGDRTRFDLPLHWSGTDFQAAVWAALQTIAPGDTLTYGALAARVGRPPTAARAVGAAVARNPLCIVLPCHRIVGRKGRMTGFAGGIWRKRWLLSHEAGAGRMFTRS